ncbi:MAG: phasin family protein [Rhodospirillales bacterium]|nr:phasin family protein [Rhodospirillales bacterium]
MTKASNPFQAFDMSKFTADFDPAKITAEFSKMTKDMNIPTVDVEAVVKTQQKNIEALTAANQSATESVKALAQRQTEIIQESIKQTQAAIDSMTKSKTPQDAAAKQVDFVKTAFESAFSNMRELADFVATTNKENMDKFNSRVAESFEEMQALGNSSKN